MLKWATAGVIAALSCAAPASAQVAATATLLSDHRFRGYSISRERPVLDLTIAYDHASGGYANGSLTGVWDGGSGPDFLSASANVGYAKRLAGGPVVDVGLIHTEYTAQSSLERAAGYSEIYAGVIGRNVSSHVYFSPNYLRPGVETVYADVQVFARPARSLRVSGHAGLLTRVAGPRDPYAADTQYDFPISAARRLGPLDLHVAWTTAGPDRAYYGGRPRSRNGLVFGVSYTH